MMNRSVMERQMFAKGGPVKYMQQGGSVAPMPMAAPPMAAPMPMAAPPMAAPPMDPMAAAQEAVNPAELEAMLSQASQTIGDLDQAGSYEEVMNMMRGDEASVEERRSELAGLVGPEDAQQTPESVLTLVQPVIQMASVDQGIGGLAQDQMSAPVEGDMAGGIMSTVNMGAPEGPPPVNFNQGGAVFPPPPTLKPENIVQGVEKVEEVEEVEEVDPFTENFNRRLARYQSLIPSTDREATREALRRNAQSQFFFDLANAGLLLASPSEQPMSFAEKLAGSVAGSGVFSNLAEQSRALTEAEAGFREQDANLAMAAMSAAEEAEARAEERAAEQPEAGIFTAVGPDGESYSGYFTDSQLNQLMTSGFQVFEGSSYDPEGEADVGFTTIKTADGEVRTVRNSEVEDLVDRGATVVTTPSSKRPMPQPLLFLKGNNKIVLNTLDGGQTVRFTDPATGDITDIPMQDAVDRFGNVTPITGDEAAQIAASFARESELNLQLDHFRQTGEFASPGFNPLSAGAGDIDLSYAVESAEELAPGSGLLEEAAQRSGGVGAAAMSSASTLTAAFGMGEFAAETTEAKKDLEFFMVLARAALVTNPRYPVTELEQVSRLFPNPREVFSNPAEGVRTIRRIKKALLKLKYDTLLEQRNLAGSGRASPTREGQLAESLRHVNLALSMVQDVDLSRDPNLTRTIGTTSFADFVLSDADEIDRVNAGREGVE